MAAPVPLSRAMAGMPSVSMPAVSMPAMAGQGPGSPIALPATPTLTQVTGLPQGQFPALVAAPGTGAVSPDQNAPDPISWVLDMLDRPRRAVADTLSGVSDLAIDSTKATGNAKGQAQLGADIGEIASGIPRGLFSTNSSDQQTTSQLIERGADRYGKLNDPHYKDTTDNVNPVLKGILGFVGDVATDPITYLGGPEIRAALSGGKALLTGAVRGVKDLGPGGALAADVAKVADKAIGGDAKSADLLDSMSAGAATDVKRAEVPPTAGPITSEGQAAALTGTDAPATATTPVAAWTNELETQLADAQAKLDKAIGTKGEDRAAAKVDALLAQKQASLKGPEAATPTPEAATPAPEAAGSTPNPVTGAPNAPAAEPLSIGQLMRQGNPKIPGSGNPDKPGSYPNLVKGISTLMSKAQAENLTIKDSMLQLKQQGVMDSIFGSAFASHLARYGNDLSTRKALNAVYKAAISGGHLDDFSGIPTQGRALLHSALKDMGIVADQVQTDRAAFKAASAVPEVVTLGTTTARMHGAPTLRNALADELLPGDVKTLLSDSLHRLRDDKPGMEYPTKSGAKSTEPEPSGTSYAEHRDRLGTFNQMGDLIQASRLGAARVKVLGNLNGAGRSAAIRNLVLGVPGARLGSLTALDRIRDTLGISHHLDDSQGRSITMSAAQAIELLSSVDQRVADKTLFNAGTPVSKSNLLEAFVGAAHGDTPEQIRATLTKADKWWRDGDQPNFLSQGSELGTVHHTLETGSVKAGPGEVAVPNINKNGVRKGTYIKQSADSLADQLTERISALRTDLAELSKTNQLSYSARFAQETHDVTAAAMAAADEMAASPTMQADAIRALANPREFAAAVGDPAGARADSVEAAAGVLEGAIPPGAQEIAQQITKAAAATTKGDRAAAAAAKRKASDAGAKQVEDAYDAAGGDVAAAESGMVPDIGHLTSSEEVPPSTPPSEVEVGQPAEPIEPVVRISGASDVTKKVTEGQKIVGSEYRALGRIQQRWVVTMQAMTSIANKSANMVHDGYSMEALHTALVSKTSVLANQYQGTLRELSAIDQQVTDTLKISDIVLNDALRGLPSADEYRAQRELTDKALSPWMNAGDWQGRHAMLAEPWLNLGISPDHLVNHLVASGVLPEDFKLTKELRATLEGDRATTGSFAGAIARFIKQSGINIPDAYDFHSKMMGAAMTLGGHAGLAHDAIDQGISRGWMSRVRESGMVRIESLDRSVFAAVINAEPLYVYPELAGDFIRMSKLLNPKSKEAGELAHLLQFFDDIQQLWKWGEVSVRPGTRVHNYISDHVMTFLAVGAGFMAKDFRSAYARSLKMMAANRGEGAFTMEELIQSLQHVGGNVADRAYKGADEAIFKGEHGEYTAASGMRLFEKAGLRTQAKAIERSDKENLSLAGKGAQSVYSSPLGQMLNKLTETTENQVRLTHFNIQLQRALKTGKVATRYGHQVSVLGKNGKIDEDVLATVLGDSVRRYHPDPHMLTNWERNVPRRIAPFYSWNRSAVPAIIDAMYMHPGRGLAFNKLSFAVGQSMGVQGNNLADPFPNGGWPGFLTGQAQGPQVNIDGSLFMANPGIPTWDVANMFTDQNNISGSISPFIAAPVTALTGKDIRTGQQVTNPWDAIDQQLPLVANIASGTGYSPLGSLVGLLTGNGPQKTSAGAQQQIDSSQGPVTLLNYLTGIQATHVNKDAYAQMGAAQQQQRLLNIMTGKSPSLGAGG